MALVTLIPAGCPGSVHEADVPAVLARVDGDERPHAAAPRVSARIVRDENCRQERIRPGAAMSENAASLSGWPTGSRCRLSKAASLMTVWIRVQAGIDLFGRAQFLKSTWGPGCRPPGPRCPRGRSRTATRRIPARRRAACRSGGEGRPRCAARTLPGPSCRRRTSSPRFPPDGSAPPVHAGVPQRGAALACPVGVVMRVGIAHPSSSA